MRVYLDNASTTAIALEVQKEMLDAMRFNFGNPSSIHWHGRNAKAVVEKARKLVAKQINASIGEIFFTSSATEAHNMILQNAVRDLKVERIISVATEHHCILNTLQYLQIQKHVEVIILEVDSAGHINYEQLSVELNEGQKVTLVSIMHVNNEIGTIHDIEKIGKMCKSNNAYFHCDTVQSFTKLPIDVQEMNIDFMAGSAHKIHGPKGIGFVYLKNENMLQPLLYGGAQERNIRAGTENTIGIVGFAAAIELANINMETWQKHILACKQYFIEGLMAISHEILINGLSDSSSANHIISVSFPQSEKADMLVMNLDIAGISASSASACSAGIEEDSHVMIAIQHPPNRKAIRFSFSYETTFEELDFTLETIKKVM